MFFFLQTPHMLLSFTEERLRGHLSWEGPSSQIAQFGRWSGLFFVAFPRSVPPHNLVSELCRQFDLTAQFQWAIRRYIETFQSKSNQLIWPQVDSNQSETSQRWWREMGGSWAQFQQRVFYWMYLQKQIKYCQIIC